MTKPRQLAPIVGLSHDGFKFLEGNFGGVKGYTMGRMTKSRRGKLYINDAGWGPEAGSIEYGYRVPSVESMSSSARSASRALSRTSAPTSSRRLNVQDPPELSPP